MSDSKPTRLSGSLTFGPRRVQLSRAKGWRMPENTASVARPTKWGNPFNAAAAVDYGFTTLASARSFVADAFRVWVDEGPKSADLWQGPASDRARRPFVEDLHQLRGKNLACWCPLDGPCHADVLLNLANRPAVSESPVCSDPTVGPQILSSDAQSVRPDGGEPQTQTKAEGVEG